MAVSKEKFKTYGSVFDEKTRRALNKLEGRGLFDNLLSPVSVGKESNVFSAEKGDKLVCVKIYRQNTCDFKKMYKYLSADRRFEGVQKRRRAVIYAWCRREFGNLQAAHKLGINVPKPLGFFENVLVMEFLGDKNGSILLKDSEFDAKKYSKIVFDNIKILYNKGKLIHGDLSEFNMLDYKDKPYIIDLSHGIKKNYPNSEEFLERDINNLARFFKKRGVQINYEDTLKMIKNE